MTRRSALRRYFRRRPVATLALGGLAAAAIAIHDFQRLTGARATVHGDWSHAVVVGLTASLAVIAFTAATLWWHLRGGRGSAWLGTIVLVCVGSVFWAGMAYANPHIYAWATRFPEPPVTTTWQVGWLAFMVPCYVGLTVLSGWACWRSARNRRTLPSSHAERLTGMIGRAGSGWKVTWEGEGKTPRRLRAATLTEAADAATRAAIQAFRNRPPSATAEFQLSIYPGARRSGPIWEVGGTPGLVWAHDRRRGRIVQGATFEELLAATQSSGKKATGELRWLRPALALHALPMPTPPTAR